jgi:D-cysteine desulfhydrase
LELVQQLKRESIPLPHTLVVPLGSGGTVAGLLVGLALAGAPTRVVGVRVVPRIVANRWRVLRLARRTRTLLSEMSGEKIPAVNAARLEIDNAWYGGAYARETDAARNAMRVLAEAGGPRLDGTYSAKAFASALARARAAPDGGVLFWLTFDARWLDDVNVAPRVLLPPR